MATQTQVEVVSPEGRSVVLKQGSLGISAVFFCIATAAAPMTALLFNVPVIVSGAGWAGPAAFIVALVMLLVFTVGYVEMTKRVTSAGGFYSFVSHGFGQTLGLGTATGGDVLLHDPDRVDRRDLRLLHEDDDQRLDRREHPADRAAARLPWPSACCSRTSTSRSPPACWACSSSPR